MLAGDEENAEMAESYNSVSKWFHWVTVGLIAVALPVGFVIKYIKDSDKMPFYAVHESAGLTILLVALARIAWRLTHPPPPLPESVPEPMRKAAHVNHWLLYGALILQPTLGFIATNAQGFPLRGETAYLGFIDFPKFMEANKAVADVVQSAHTVVGISIAVLLAIHIAAAIYHQAIRRDGILLRIV
jgi:cytochrome b561